MSKERPTHSELEMRKTVLGEKIIFIKNKFSGSIQPATARHVGRTGLPFPLPKLIYCDYRFLDDDYDIQFFDRKRHVIVSQEEYQNYFNEHPNQKIYV